METCHIPSSAKSFHFGALKLMVVLHPSLKSSLASCLNPPDQRQLDSHVVTIHSKTLFHAESSRLRVISTLIMELF